MAKTRPDLRVRLQQAALELFRAHGYEASTAADIAAKAGVTERTFFRHFTDKREVLFDGETVLRRALTEAIAEAPEGAGPLAVLFWAFRAVVDVLEANRSFAVKRQKVIAATPALRERELAKHAALADVLADALRARGVAGLAAELAARAGMAAFVHVTVNWLDDPTSGLGARLAYAETVMRALWAQAG